eukprot:scaffold455785_cov48-Prasinocladus_malaysianus.AAC.1
MRYCTVDHYQRQYAWHHGGVKDNNGWRTNCSLSRFVLGPTRRGGVQEYDSNPTWARGAGVGMLPRPLASKV